MDVLAVGAGRDGTVSLTQILQDILTLNGLDGEAVHEYAAERFYNAFARWKERDDAAASRELDRLIAECPYRMVVGNGTQTVLDRFFAHFPKLKLIAIRRRDEEGHLASLEKIATMWPEVFGGYVPGSDQAMKRLTAPQVGEMSTAAWDALSLRAKLKWYREHTYATVAKFGRTAAAYLEVETEDLDRPETRQRIADFVAFPGAASGTARRLNRRQLVSLDDFSTVGGRFAMWWFRDFSPAAFAEHPGYGLDYTLEIYRRWAQSEADSALGLRGPDTNPVFDLTADELSGELTRFQGHLAYALQWSTDLRSRIESGPPARSATPARDGGGGGAAGPVDPEQMLASLDKPDDRASFTDLVARRHLPRDHHSVFWGDRMLTLDKAMGFLDDPAFASAWAGVRGAHVYDQYDNQQSIAWRLHTLVWAAKNALALPEGDFVECGVFQGDMSFVVYHAAGLAGSGRAMHLFDSWEGIDPARAVAGEYGPSGDYIAKSNAYYAREGLYESVLRRFRPLPEVSVHKGFLPETLEGRAPEKIAWLHIDLNAAKPEVETLAMLFDRVVPSGIVILDDYGWLVLRAQKDAEDAFFAKRGYQVLELPTGQGLVVKRPDDTGAPRSRPGLASTNNSDDLAAYRDVFAGITPYSGPVAAGETVNFLGIRTPHAFLPLDSFDPREGSDREETTRLPVIEDGELWFEAADWVLAAREARGRFVMATLGANYGAQAVGAAVALRTLNPMPFRLVCVEPVPENNAWIRSHMAANGIDPDAQWLIHSAIGATNDPVLFPIGSPGSGSQNCVATNEGASRAQYADELVRAGRAEEVMRNLLLSNTTGVITNLVAGYDLPAEIKLVSAVTLVDLLAPFDRVDYVEADMQQSEIVVFPPYMELLRRKVRRVHIGTHGKEVHDTLHRLFVQHGFEIVFSFEPNRSFDSPLGRFKTNDGILTAVNPALAPA